MAKRSKIQNAKNELAPSMEVAAKKDLSSYKIKDDFFTKLKTYIEKSSRQEKQIEADWINLVIGGVKITAFKGVQLTKNQLAAFDKEAKAYWLESTK